MEDPSKTPPITNLQALRAFAALNVVVFHCIGASLVYGYSLPLFGLLEGWGANGVDVFFIISGFVMVYTQWRRPRHPYNFALNRLLRIAPIYWILTALFLALLAILPATAINSAGPSLEAVTASFLFVAGIVTGQEPVLYVGWTLEYEMAFYAVFAASVFIRQQVLQLVFLAAAIICMITFLPYEVIALEFLLGVALGAFYLWGGKVRYPMLILLTGTALLAASIGSEIPSLFRPLVWGVPALLIVLGALYMPQTRSKFMTLLGDASYSIYLVQVLTIPIAYKAFSLLGIGWSGDLLLVFAVAFSAMGGIVVYFVLERPVSEWIRRHNPQFARSPLYPARL